MKLQYTIIISVFYFVNNCISQIDTNSIYVESLDKKISLGEKIVYKDSVDISGKPLIGLFEKTYIYLGDSLFNLELRFNDTLQRQKTIRLFSDGKLPSHGFDLRYHESGELKNVSTYFNGFLHGMSFTYNKLGILIKVENYIEDVEQGTSILFSETGALLEKGNMKNGLKEGKWYYYYDNGSLRQEGNYTIFPFDFNNYNDLDTLVSWLEETSVSFESVFNYSNTHIYLKDGKWKEYNEDGELIVIKVYFRGRLIKEEYQ